MEKTYKALKILLLILVFIALLLGARRLYDALGSQVKLDTLLTQSAASTQPTEEEKPEMIVYDIDGNPYKLSDFEGKPVILNFWATWCDFCKLEMPHFEEKYRQYGDEIHFLMVNATDNFFETEEKAFEYISGEGFTFPVYYDSAQTADTYFNLSSFPVTYLLDAQGGIVGWQQGMLTEEMLQTGIDKLLEKQ